MAFEDFYSYKRTAGVNINDFLIQYKFLYQKLRGFGIILPEKVKIFFCFESSKYIRRKQNLMRTMCATLTYTEMKDTLSVF